MLTISTAIPVYASDEDYSPTTPQPSPVRVTLAPATQKPQPYSSFISGGTDLDERTAAYVDLIREDLQDTDDIHNHLVDLVLEMKNEMADLTRRVKVAKQRATEAEETIAAMITGSSDTGKHVRKEKEQP
ncbi:hypothetical protein L1987_09441 [Smallanthus sonchifolius]|uniref:Uncharacterized protein n=1 Tax=Smallanthus sonchifolius TaxID=185202 RepID=A0ACB9JPK0_9ASTR|nr:hypothetical protein L1987_09441 [Smallanthus sonchifolius]